MLLFAPAAAAAPARTFADAAPTGPYSVYVHAKQQPTGGTSQLSVGKTPLTLLQPVSEAAVPLTISHEPLIPDPSTGNDESQRVPSEFVQVTWDLSVNAPPYGKYEQLSE